MSDKEINKLTTKQLTEQIKNLKLYKEQITYYGDLNIEAIEDYIFRHHKMNETGSYKKSDRKLSEKQKINYTVWSDVFICPSCTNEIVYWDVAVDIEDKKIILFYESTELNDDDVYKFINEKLLKYMQPNKIIKLYLTGNE